MDFAFIKCKLAHWVAENPQFDYAQLSKSYLYHWYMVELDYDATGDEVDWKSLRIFHREEGNIRYVLMDYQEKINGYPTYSFIAYGKGGGAIYFSCSYRETRNGGSYCLFKHNGDYTSDVIKEFRSPISRSKLTRNIMEYLRLKHVTADYDLLKTSSIQ